MSELYEVDLGLAGVEVANLLNISLSISHIRQPGKLVCWATCMAMVEQWKNKNLPFCTYVKLQSDCGSCNNECTGKSCDTGRAPTSILADWNYLGYLETSETPGMLIFPAIREYLKEGKPIQAYFVHKDRKSAHVVLVTGAMKNSECDDMLIIVDPLKEKPILIYSMLIATWGSWEKTWVIA